jgi:tetratricopeptide (TPR) repeat protein
MRLLLQKLFLPLFIFFAESDAIAQQVWPSPELEQMYKHAQEDIELGNSKDAVVIYKQAIQLAPGIFILYKELARLYYQSGSYADAEQTLASLITKPEADAECYQLMAASYAATDKIKDARSVLQMGLERFPASGLLYYEKGMEHEKEKKPEAALHAWLDGIAHDPAYAPDYYEAARCYLASDNVLWGLFYGEQFLYMKHDTAGEQELKDKLFAGYKTFFDNLVMGAAPQFGTKNNKQSANTFEEAVRQVYTSLTPVVSDGITTENLTMVRTRFLMDWFSGYGGKYPFSLFSYEDELVRSGHFDMGNEWLFGMAESKVQYEAWNTFHPGDLNRLMEWQAANRIQPSSTDFYNDGNMDGLFDRKKK